MKILSCRQALGEIAASAPHAVHMPGHIFARLGLWQADIDANRGSVAALEPISGAPPETQTLTYWVVPNQRVGYTQLSMYI
jgi:hypothetical protein